VPAAASGAGKNGTQWRTDVRVMALNGLPAPLNITFFPSDGSAPLSGVFALPSGGFAVIDDVVGELGGSGSGGLVIRSAINLIGSSRTYNTTENGTYGQFIPAVTFFNEVHHGTIVGVADGPDYRTNVGIFNATDDSTEAVVSLFSDDDVLLGSGSWSLDPWRHLQLNDIFEILGAPPSEVCRVDIDCQEWPCHTYASVVDNRSGDAVYLPAFDADQFVPPR